MELTEDNLRNKFTLEYKRENVKNNNLDGGVIFEFEPLDFVVQLYFTISPTIIRLSGPIDVRHDSFQFEATSSEIIEIDYIPNGDDVIIHKSLAEDCSDFSTIESAVKEIEDNFPVTLFHGKEILIFDENYDKIYRRFEMNGQSSLFLPAASICIYSKKRVLRLLDFCKKLNGE